LGVYFSLLPCQKGEINLNSSAKIAGSISPVINQVEIFSMSISKVNKDIFFPQSLTMKSILPNKDFQNHNARSDEHTIKDVLSAHGDFK
jgi:hypothetical protein